MNSRIKISVIIPIYNMEKYLQECLDTVRGQSLQEIEILCINDGSRDNSKEIIVDNSKEDERVILIDQENQGVGAARNAGLEQATGEYVVFMDPDDWYPSSDVLEVLYNAAKENDVLICGGSFSELSDKGLVTEFTGVREKYAFKEDGIVYYRDYQFDYGYHRFIYSLQFLRDNQIQFPLYIRFQDPPFFVKAMIKAEKFYAMKKITYKYRVGHQQINWTERRLLDLLRGLTDTIRMSGEYELQELHRISVERLAKNYLDMYASIIGNCSTQLIEQLIEAERCINVELLSGEKRYEGYQNLVGRVLERAIVLAKEEAKDDEKEKNGYRDMETKFNDIQNSMSFKVGRIVTWVPRKIRGLFTGEK